eukprot:IDg12164t1
MLTATFNLNAYSDEKCLTDFCFRRNEIPAIAGLCRGTIPARRSKYGCENMTATCLFLRRLAYPCRWSYMESTFGMRFSKIKEMIREVA